MFTIRKEVQMYARDCERLLSLELDPELTRDEQDLIVYYAQELVREFDVIRRNGTAISSPHRPQLKTPPL